MVPKSSLENNDLHPRKKWGQNFLTDPRILQSIADAAEVDSEDTILEIGPGLGHLTRVLAARAKQVVAVEIDPDLAARLWSEWAGSRTVKILQGDILSRQAAEWIGTENVQPEGAGEIPAPDFKVVANLPYYITSAILRHLLEAPIRPHIIVVMVQREVAQRMTARPPEMNLLAVSVQFFAHVRVIRTIAPGAFFPRPQVESAVVRLDLTAQPPLPAPEIPPFFDLVRAGFGERRKQLRNSLAHGLHLDPPAASNLLTRAHIDPARRAETLRLDEWAELYRVWAHFPIVG